MVLVVCHRALNLKYRNFSFRTLSRDGGGGGGGGGEGQDHVNPEFADSALLLPLNLYGEKRRPFCWANETCRALL